MEPARCASCGAEADPAARFCAACGHTLVESCPTCGAETRAGARFCASCGRRLVEQFTADEERKLVTVLFADLTGSTALGETLDPERLRTLLAEYFAAMAAVVESWGGVVEKFIGDAVMAVFGIPVAREDDAERALRAALGMHERLAELNDEIEARHGVELAVRIGVNSGEVIAGVGGDQFLVTGDAVNVAARLQQTAGPGEVVAGERTLLAARGTFRVEPIEERALKGKSTPVRASRVLGADDLAPPSRRPALGRLVGRTRELSVLETLYKSSVDEARPALVTVLGHAGVGKSRLTEEFVGAVGSRGPAPTVHRGRCLWYGEGITYWALREILWSAAGILLDDPSEAAADKLSRFVRELIDDGIETGEADRVRFGLATSAGIALPDNPLDEMSPESIGEELGLAWPRFLSALAARGPTIVLIDDLHRAEPPLLDMVEHVVSRSTGPLFLVATGRPELAELRPGWSVKHGMTQTRLDPLSESQAEDLLDQLAPGLSPGLRERILGAAEGNPLFAEEIVEHLVDSGTLVRSDGAIVEVAPNSEVTIPDTVRAVLTARVDALTGREKRVLQDAAVVGRVFWSTVLSSMADRSVRVELRALEDKGFVVTRPSSSLAGQTELTFRHGLMREVAYDSIPKARRAAVHADVGRWIETVAGDRRDEVIELIAYHLEAAAQPEDAELAWPTDSAHREEIRRAATRTLVDAGRAELATFAIDQALGFGDRALELARSDSERLEALTLKAQAAQAAPRPNEAWAHYSEALAAAQRLGDAAEARRLRAWMTLLWSRWRGMMTGDDWQQTAEQILTAGLEEVGDGPPSFELGAFLTGRSASRFWQMGAPLSPEDAKADAERAIEIAQAIDSETLLSYALDTQYSELMRDGFCDSHAWARTALPVGRAMKDRGEAHELLVSSAIALSHAGRFEEAAAVAAETADLAARLGPHRRLHTGSAQTWALYSPGRLTELGEATAAAADLVEEEERRTCFHGLTALAGQAVAAFESGDSTGAQRALELFDSATTDGIVTFPAYWIDMLRPLIGVADARRRHGKSRNVDDSPSVQGLVHRLRLELQLSALERDWVTFHEVVRTARSLAARACAPYLAWVADWGQAVELAERGEDENALAKAWTAASALSEYGMRYPALRLLVDLLPALSEHAAPKLASEVAPSLDAMGAGTSAEQARLHLV